MSSATETLRPGEAKAAADPCPATALVQAEFVYSFTVEPASALPITFGALLFAGDAGLVELTVGAVLLVLSVAINARGALSWDTALWNPFPVNVDQRPERLWDWSEPQFLAGAIKPLGSGAEVYDPRRP